MQHIVRTRYFAMLRLDKLHRCTCSCVVALFLMCINGSLLTEGKIADACHGISTVGQTYNRLECEKGSRICITEVRYHQWHPDGVCPHMIASPAPPECCRHDASRCNWKTHTINEAEGFQKNCSGGNRCELYSPSSQVIANECPISVSTASSVRSIIYTCTSTGTCPSTQTTKMDTTTVTNASTAQPRGQVGAIIGGVVGGVLLVIAIVIIILLWRRSRIQDKSQDPSPTNIAQVTVPPSADSTTNSTSNNPVHNSYINIEEESTSPAYIDMTIHHNYERSSREIQQLRVPPDSDSNIPPSEESSIRDYYNIGDETRSPTYYNTPQDEDNDYIEMLDRGYNIVRLSRIDPDNSYTTLS